MRLAGRGEECDVFAALSPLWGKVAIKVARQRIYSTDNEAALDMRPILRQEFELAAILAGSGVPVAEPIYLHAGEAGEPDFLVSVFVSQRRPAPDDEALGATVRCLHEVDLRGMDAPGWPGVTAPWSPALAERITFRLARLAARTGQRLATVDLAGLLAAREAGRAPVSLLHMDVRDANLVWQAGRLAAVLDWSNAILADPLLELMRIEVYGEVGERFWSGYGWSPRGHADDVLLDAYRLDTAVMLANVFVRTGERDRAARYLAQVQKLCQRLA